MYIAKNSIGDIHFTNPYHGGIYVKNVITITLRKTVYKRDNSICEGKLQAKMDADIFTQIFKGKTNGLDANFLMKILK